MKKPFAVALVMAGMALAPGLPAQADELRLGVARTDFAESYSAQGVDTRLSGLEHFMLAWQSPLGSANRLLLQLSRTSYQFDNVDFPGTRHRRQQTGVLLGARRDLGLAHGHLGLGAGYSLELLQVQNSATLPSGESEFLFMPWQAFHGPAMLADLHVPILGPVGFRLAAEWHPVLFAQLSDSSLSMPGYMTRVKVDPRVTLWGDRLSFGYVYQRTLGSGYDRAAAGFLASVSLLGI